MIQAIKVHALCELYLHRFRDKLLYDFDQEQVSTTTYYAPQYIRKSIQAIYSISKYTFKLIKLADIYKVHHYEIVLVSLSWIQIN